MDSTASEYERLSGEPLKASDLPGHSMRHLYYNPNTIDLQKMIDHAQHNRPATVHYHAHGESCTVQCEVIL